MGGRSIVKYIVKNTGGFGMMSGDEVLKNLLIQRGVEDVDTFLTLPHSVLNSPFLLKNMNEGIDLLAKHLNRKSKILILIDSDSDGYGSASMMYQFIKEISGIECQYFTHKDKRHGLHNEVFDGFDFEFDLIICPDSTTNDVEMCKKLKEAGKDILVIDHHIIEVENTYATIINNQDGQYPNRTLVAGAVVYKFIQAFKQAYEINVDMRKYLALAALTLIADMADLRQPESRLMTLEGLKLFHLNGFLRELCDKQSFAMKDKRTIKTVAWSIAPLINATIRFASYEEKIMMFEAMAGIERLIPYKPKKSKNNPNPVEEMISIQSYMAKKCANIKKRQDDSVKKNVNLLVESIEQEGLDQHKIIMVEAGELPQAYTGLVANKLAQRYRRPCLILRRKDSDQELFGGSARNYAKFELTDLRGFLMKSGLMTGSGHSEAFGINLPASNKELVLNYADEELKEVEIQDVHHVDYEFPLGQLSSHDVLVIGQYQDIWGGGLEAPIFLISDIHITSDQVELIGEKRNILRIRTKLGNQELTFIKFFANEKFYNELIHRSTKGFSSSSGKKLKLTVVGEFKVSEYQGEKSPQIEIIDVHSEEVKTVSYF